MADASDGLSGAAVQGQHDGQGHEGVEKEDGSIEVIDLVGDDEEEFSYGEEIDDDVVEIVAYEDESSSLLDGSAAAIADGAAAAGAAGEGGGPGRADAGDREELAARSALVRAAEETGEGCWWCTHSELAGSWLRAFVCAGEAATGDPQGQPHVLFERLKNDTYGCMRCQDAYGEARRTVLEYLESRAAAEAAPAGAVARLAELDRAFVLLHLRHAHGTFFRTNQVPDSFMFCLLDLLVHAELYFGVGAPPEIDRLFGELMQPIGAYIDMEEDIHGRQMPGVFLLLTHPSPGVRAFVAKMVKGLGQISLAMFEDCIAPSVRRWYRVLEDEYLRATAPPHQRQPAAAPAAGGPNPEEIWKALSCLLQEVAPRDETLGEHLFSEFPLLPEIALQHAEEATAPPTGGSAAPPVRTQRVALEALRLMLDRFGPVFWWHAEGASPGGVLEWLKARLLLTTAAQPVLVEPVFVALLHLLRAFLRSLPHGGGRDSIGGGLGGSWHGGLTPQPVRQQARRASLVDSAIRTLVRLSKELPVTAPLTSQRQVESTLCEVVADAYDPTCSSAADWPLASADEWAPLMIKAMGPFGTVDGRKYEERARGSVLLVLRQHARDVRERVLELARGGVGVADDDEEEDDDDEEEEEQGRGAGARRDLFCRRLLHELMQSHPLQNLPVDVRDCLFSIQANLYLAMPLRRQLRGSATAPGLNATKRAFLTEARAIPFEDLLVRYCKAVPELNLLGKGPLPLASVVPLLLLGDDDAGLKQTLLVLLARSAGQGVAFGAAMDWPTALAAVTRQKGAPLLKGLWQGAGAVAKDLRKAGLCEGGATLAVLPRFLDVLRTLAAASGAQRLKEAGGPLLNPWWRGLGLELLGKARQRFEVGRGAAGGSTQQPQLLSPPLMRGFCEVTRALLPGLTPARLREHAAWASLLLDWANDPRAVEWDRGVHHGMVELLLALIKELRSREVPLKEALGVRIQRLARAKPGSGDTVEPSLGRRLQALVDTEGLLIEGQEAVAAGAGAGARAAARPALPMVDISGEGEGEGDKMDVDQEEEGDWPWGPTSPSPPPSPARSSVSAAEAPAEEEREEEAAAPVAAAAAASAAPAAAARAAVDVITIPDDEDEEEEQGPRRRVQKAGAPSSKSAASAEVRSRIVLSAGGKKGPAAGASSRRRELLAPPKAKQSKTGGGSAAARSAPLQQQQQPPGPYQQPRQSVESLQAGVVRPPARAADDFELFRHLKEVSKRVPIIARRFHGQVLRWSLPTLLAREPSAVLDDVPLRFRDTRHYIDTYVPLVLEELRAALGSTLQEGLQRRRQLGGGRGGGRAQRDGRGRNGRREGGNNAGDRVGETTTLDLQQVQADGEKDGLATLHLLFDYRRNALESRMRGVDSSAAGGGQDLFVLRPAKARAGLLEDGELDEGLCLDGGEDSLMQSVLASDGRGGGGGGRRRGRGRDAGEEAAAQQESHLLAVLLDIGENDQQAGAGDVWRLRVAITPQAAASGGIRWSELKPNTRWRATMVGSLTTSLREFAAVHELLELRLAPRLLMGGKGQLAQPAQNLTEIDLAGLVARGREIEALLERCEKAAGGQHPAADLETLRQKIRALRWLRISQRLLFESQLGKLVGKRCGGAPWTAIQEAAAMVVEQWKSQVAAEKDCYQGAVKETVLAGVSQDEGGGGGDSQSQTMGGGPGDAARRASVASSSQRERQEGVVRCPIQLPVGLFRVLRQQFNSSQLRAICAATHIHSSAFTRGFEVTLLQGPPGTGKTRTIIGLLSALVNSSDYWRQINTARKSIGGSGAPNIRPGLRPSGRGNRILVCAPSNGAVDEITLRLWKTGLLDAEGRAVKLPIIRIGAVDPEADPNLQQASLDFQVEREVQISPELNAFELADAEVARLRKEVAAAIEAATEAGLRGAQSRSKEGRISEQEMLRAAEMRRRAVRAELTRAQKQRWTALKALEALRSRARNRLIKEAKIVLSTLSSSAVPYLTEAVLSSALGFETVVVDEAGQAVEPSSLIPLKYGAKNLVLVGDPRQLPATVLSKAAPEKGYDRSLFERLERGGHPVFALRVQYRMDPEIRAFPSVVFYDNKLLDAPEVTARRNDPASPSVFLRQAPYFPPYMVVDVACGQEQTPGGERSMANEAEAALALGLCQRLWLEFPLLDAEHMAVITPYRSQVGALHRCFQRALGEGYARRVDLSTVDGFQGREKTVIILSCVRTVPGRLGFIQDLRRLNVALTRARHSLFVLGRCEALVSHETWRALIEDAAARRCLVRLGESDRGFDDLALRLLYESAAAAGQESMALALPTTARPLPPALVRPSSAAASAAPAREPPRQLSASSSSGAAGARKGSAAPTRPAAPVLARSSASSSSSGGTDAMLSGLIDRAEASASARAAAAAAGEAAAADDAAAAERAASAFLSERRPPASRGPSAGPLSKQDEAAIEAERARRQRQEQHATGGDAGGGWLPRRPLSGGGSKSHARAQPSHPAPTRTAAASSSSSSSSYRGTGSKGGSAAAALAPSSYKGTSSKTSSTTSTSSSNSRKRSAPARDEVLHTLGTSKRKIGSSTSSSTGGGTGGSAAPTPLSRERNAPPMPPPPELRAASSSSLSSSSAPQDGFTIPKKAGAAPSSRAAASSSSKSAAQGNSQRPPAAATGKKPNKKPSFSLNSLLDDL